uniref:non-specific serine/threonine protein kinase n=1 Tax=Vernicia montana TaxID=316732 RepID=A0A140G4V7_9ROSI|nr:LRR-RLK [Vernicia montana]
MICEYRLMSLITLPLLLLVCKVGSEFRIVNAVLPPLTGNTGNPYNRRDPSSVACNKAYSRYCLGREYRQKLDCATDGGLPCYEVYALRAVTRALRLPSMPYISREYCNDGKSEDSITVGCNCTEKNGTVCHITRISTSSIDLSGGRIHENVSHLTYLKTLDLSYNHLHCTIPESLGNLKSLVTLNLHNNFLNGSIPSSFQGLSSLKTLSLRNNKLSGPIPKELGSLSNLVTMRLEENELYGHLPPELGKLSKLERLDLSSNNLTGNLPRTYDKLTSLEIFGVAGNSLNGQIPEFISKWTNLRELYLIGNDFEGHLPLEIFNMSKLDMLWVSDLRNPGFSFPEHANMTNIENLILRNCNIIGPVPEYIANWIWNYILEARDKYCQGKSKYYSLFINCGGGQTSFEGNQYDEDINETKFYESPGGKWAYSCSGDFLSASADSSDYLKNMTCGVSEQSLHETARLCPTSLTYYGFCLHKGNYTVKLHFAEIVYTKDEDYSSSGKRIFDVYIQGEKKLENFNIKDEAGWPNKLHTREFVTHVDENPLVIHFFWAGKGSIYNTPQLNGPLVSAISVTPNFTIPEGNKLSTSKIVGIAVGSAFAPILLLAFLWKMGWLGNKELQEVHIKVRKKSFTLQQIIDGTRDFSSKMEIGRGRFGIVYKAEMPDQTKLAVKKISPESTQDKLKDELQGEIFFNVKSLEHENLIQLFDGYSKKDLHLLIYEYMENGSLDQALFEPKSRIELNWEVRFNICLGLAKALKYLHEENVRKIIHRNIKASNILLDENYTAKLTDFGLASFDNEDDPFKTIKAGGARAYFAPEYARGQAITDKADVYSFGVVTLEIFSGRSCTENKSEAQKYLLDDACIFQARGKIDQLVDKKLANYDRKLVPKILNLAIMCINPTADLRPTMSEVVSVLSGGTLEQISKVHTSSENFSGYYL